MLANVNILKNLLVYARLRFVAVWQKMEKRGKAKWKKKKEKNNNKKRAVVSRCMLSPRFLTETKTFSDAAFPSCRVLTRCQEALWKVKKLLVAAQAVWKRC